MRGYERMSISAQRSKVEGSRGITDDVAGKRPRKLLQQVMLGTCEVRDCEDAIASTRGRVRSPDLECLAFLPYSGQGC